MAGYNFIQKFMVDNDCYNTNQKIKPQGIMIHSTATPGVKASAWFNLWNKPGVKACVHAFIDDTEVWQYLPWDHRGWHAGGKANDTHIGMEICEPAGFKYGPAATMIGYDVAKNQEYFEKAYNNAVDVTVMLCRKYNISPSNTIDHSEGHALGIAANHADVKHWFPLHGKSMSTFREDVKSKLDGLDGLEQWQIDMGSAAIDELAKQGLLNDAPKWKKSLDQPIPQWLAWEMFVRIFNKLLKLIERMS